MTRQNTIVTIQNIFMGSQTIVNHVNPPAIHPKSLKTLQK